MIDASIVDFFVSSRSLLTWLTAAFRGALTDGPISNVIVEGLKDDEQKFFTKKAELDVEKPLHTIRSEMMRSSGNISGKIGCDRAH